MENKDMENKNSFEPQIEDSEKNQKTESALELNNPELLVEYKPVEGKPATVKCPNCGEEMPTTIDTCVCCGHYLDQKKGKKAYKPIEENKAKKIRWIIGIVCVVAFIIWYVIAKV